MSRKRTVCDGYFDWSCSGFFCELPYKHEGDHMNTGEKGPGEGAYELRWRNEPKVRATGGIVHAGDTYVVGERGPELFVPDQDGLIEPNKGGA